MFALNTEKSEEWIVEKGIKTNEFGEKESGGSAIKNR